MDTHETSESEARRWLVRLFHWSNFWFHIGLWIWAGLLWLLHRWVPSAFRVVELSGGILTGLAFFYMLHYMVFTSSSPAFRRLCFPLIGLIDFLAVGGIIALIFKPE